MRQTRQVFELLTLKLDNIQANDLQPEARTTKTAVRGLAETIDMSRMFVPPILARISNGRKLRLIDVDGHRRIEVAKGLGLTTLQCLVFDTDEAGARRYFTLFNSGAAAFKSATWLASWARSNSQQERDARLDEMPPHTARLVKALVKLIGQRASIDYGLSGRFSPDVVKQVSLAQQMFAHHGLSPLKPARIVEWISKFKMSREVITVSLVQDSGNNPGMRQRHVEALHAAIKSDRGYRSRLAIYDCVRQAPRVIAIKKEVA